MKQLIEPKRINNLAFKQCTYLGNIPEHPHYEIVKYQNNPYYQKESDFIKDGDFYRPNNETYHYVSIHKDCFKSPESCYTIATFREDDGGYYIHCYTNIAEFDNTEMLDFRDLGCYGLAYLKELDSEEE